VIPFQGTRWDDPIELFGSQGFRFSVDPEREMAVFFASDSNHGYSRRYFLWHPSALVLCLRSADRRFFGSLNASQVLVPQVEQGGVLRFSTF
jgi:hypothetical protein